MDGLSFAITIFWPSHIAAKRSLRPYSNISNLLPFPARILNRALASIKCVAVASATSRQSDFYTPVHLHVARDTP